MIEWMGFNVSVKTILLDMISFRWSDRYFDIALWRGSLACDACNDTEHRIEGFPWFLSLMTTVSIFKSWLYPTRVQTPTSNREQPNKPAKVSYLNKKLWLESKVYVYTICFLTYQIFFVHSMFNIFHRCITWKLK